MNRETGEREGLMTSNSFRKAHRQLSFCQVADSPLAYVHYGAITCSDLSYYESLRRFDFYASRKRLVDLSIFAHSLDPALSACLFLSYSKPHSVTYTLSTSASQRLWFEEENSIWKTRLSERERSLLTFP